MKLATRLSPLLLAGALLPGCAHAPEPAPAPAVTQPAAATPAPQAARRYSRLSRSDFNAAAARMNLPLYWVGDKNGNGQMDPEEVVTLLFYADAKPGPFSKSGVFTPEFDKIYVDMVTRASGVITTEGINSDEVERRRLVQEDIDQGRPTLIRTDLRVIDSQERVFALKMIEVANLIDQLYAAQNGLDAIAKQLPTDDPASHRLFWRNWRTGCVGPATENNKACTAIPGIATRLVGVYPPQIQRNPKFCADLEKGPEAKAMTDHFTAVRMVGGELVTVPYHQAWPELTRAVADKLNEAAELLDTSELPLKVYLQAAAQGFTTNDWLAADEAWAKMNSHNSRWYVRVGPDESYWEPCNLKAGFHLSFARINTESLQWQQKVEPYRQEMEAAIAKLVGAPYKARKVSFHLPDFIDIVFNAGDSRHAMSATLGQSLPNWGPVANEGRGRTMAVSNLYTDPDSVQIRRSQAESLFAKESLTYVVDDRSPDLVSTLLHEATHNLGPAHEYKVGNKTDTQIFGGPLSSTMEELKAQTGALWYSSLLLKKKVISPDFAKQLYGNSIVWAMGHISRGMYEPGRKPKPYSQLSAVQIGTFIKSGAMRYDPELIAANGVDKGAFVIDYDKLPAAVDQLMKTVGKIKASGDRKGAEALITEFADGPVVPQAVIAERMLRFPKASFVYAVDQ